MQQRAAEVEAAQHEHAAAADARMTKSPYIWVSLLQRGGSRGRRGSVPSYKPISLIVPEAIAGRGSHSFSFTTELITQVVTALKHFLPFDPI